MNETVLNHVGDAENLDDDVTLDIVTVPSQRLADDAAIVAANRSLQPYVASQRAEIELQLAQASKRARAHRVLDSREYAFCLFPPEMLQHFVLDFSS